MKYKSLENIFSGLKNSKQVSSNIYGIHIGENESDNFAICLSGEINSETNNEYVEKIIKYKTSFKCMDFSLGGYESKAYGVADLALGQSIWNSLKELIENSKNISEIKEKCVTDAISLTVVDLRYNGNTYYCLAYQEPTTKLYKKKKVYTVGSRLVSLKPNEFFTMTSDLDCIIDEQQWCFYSLRNTNVIKLFDLNIAIMNEVKNKKEIIDQWTFVDNIDDIKSNLDKKNVYEPLFKIISDEDYVKQLKIIQPSQFKERLIRVSKGQIVDNDFKDNRLCVNNQNRAFFLKLLAKKLKYNIGTDAVEE